MIVPKLVFQLHDDDDTVKEVEPDKDHVFDHNHSTDQNDAGEDVVKNEKEKEKEEDEINHCSLSSPWSTSNQDEEVVEAHRSSIADYGDDHITSSSLGGDPDANEDAASGICSKSDQYDRGDHDIIDGGMRNHPPDNLLLLDNESNEDVDDDDVYNICSISDLHDLDSKQPFDIDNEDVFIMSPFIDSGPVAYSPGPGRREGVDMTSILPSIADLQALDGGTETELPRKQMELDFKQPLDAAVILQSPEEEDSVDGIWFRTENQV